MDPKLKNLLIELDSSTLSPSQITSKLSAFTFNRLSRTQLLSITATLLTIARNKQAKKLTDQPFAILSFWKEQIYPVDEDLFKPDKFDFLMLESELQETLGDLISCIGCLREAVQIMPQDPSVYFGLAKVYKQFKDHRMCYICSHQAIKILHNMLYEKKEFDDKLRNLLSSVYLIASEEALFYKNFKLATTYLTKAKPLLEKLKNFQQIKDLELILKEIEEKKKRYTIDQGRRRVGQSLELESKFRDISSIRASESSIALEQPVEPQNVEFRPDMIQDSLAQLMVEKKNKEDSDDDFEDDEKENIEPRIKFILHKKPQASKSERENELENENENLKKQIKELEEKLANSNRPPSSFYRSRTIVANVRDEDTTKLLAERDNYKTIGEALSNEIKTKDDEISRLNSVLETFKSLLSEKEVDEKSLKTQVNELTLENEKLKKELLKYKLPEKKAFMNRKANRWKYNTFQAYNWIKNYINFLIENQPTKYREVFLEIGKNEPLLLNHTNRLRLYSETLEAHKIADSGYLRLNIRREHLVEDSYQLFAADPESWIKSISVKFQNEDGFDSGGLTAEWFSLIAEKIYDPALGIFDKPETVFFYHPRPIVNDYSIGIFKFLGHYFSKVLRSDRLVPICFSKLFIKLILEQDYNFEDFEEIDPEYYKTLNWMIENEFDPEELDQYFVYEKKGPNGTEVKILGENGQQRRVDNSNKYEYVDKVTKAKYVDEIQPLVEAFKSTFYIFIPNKIVQIFRPYEFELLVGGKDEIKVEDLEMNTEYSGHNSSSPVIKWFWEVVEEFDQQNLRGLLHFITGTTRIPAGGFLLGNRKIKISKQYGRPDQLPKAHSCFWTLDLPEYHNKNELRAKLIMAISEGREGYGLA